MPQSQKYRLLSHISPNPSTGLRHAPHLRLYLLSKWDLYPMSLPHPRIALFRLWWSLKENKKTTIKQSLFWSCKNKGWIFTGLQYASWVYRQNILLDSSKLLCLYVKTNIIMKIGLPISPISSKWALHLTSSCCHMQVTGRKKQHLSIKVSSPQCGLDSITFSFHSVSNSEFN